MDENFTWVGFEDEGFGNTRIGAWRRVKGGLRRVWRVKELDEQDEAGEGG